MGYIIRNRLFPGTSVVDGNNPPKIQGNTVSRKVSGRETIVRDYLNLTDSILALPRAVEHFRYESPLMGGITTVKNHSGPVNDYLALQYLKDAPPQGYMGPTNRVVETPDITIGKAGTIDVKLKCHIRTLANAKALGGGPAELIDSVWYNLTDFDDPTAPAYPLKLTDRDWTAKLLPPTKTLAGLEGPGRIVGLVTLADSGLKAIKAARAAYTRAGGHPCELFSKFGWFELLIIEDEIDLATDLKDIEVLGAKRSEDKKSFTMNWSPELPKHAAVPVERCNISVAANTKTHKDTTAVPLEYAPVPVWDIKKIDYDTTGGYKCKVTATIDGTEVTIPINTTLDTKVVKYDVRHRGALRPIFQHTDKQPLDHPFFPDSVFPYLRADAQGENSPFHFVPRWEITALAQYATWKPNTYASVSFKIAEDTKTVSLPSGHFMTAIVPPDAIPPQIKTLENVNLTFTKIGHKSGTATFVDLADTGLPGVKFEGGKLSGKVEAAAKTQEYVIPITLKVGTVVVDTYPLKLNIVKAAYINEPEGFKDWYLPGEVVDIKFTKAGPDSGTATFAEIADTGIKGVTFNKDTGRLYGKIADDAEDKMYSIPITLKLAATLVDTYPLKLTIGNGGYHAEGADFTDVPAVGREEQRPNVPEPVSCTRLASRLIRTPYQGLDDIDVPAVGREEQRPNVPEPVSCTRLASRLIRTPCQGPDDIEVMGFQSDGTERILDQNEYTLSGPDKDNIMTIALVKDPKIRTILKIA